MGKAKRKSTASASEGAAPKAAASGSSNAIAPSSPPLPIKAKKRTRQPVQIFECPSAFPEERKELDRRRNGNNVEKFEESRGALSAPPVLNFHKAAEEVRTLGSTRFQRPQKRKRREEMYEQITGMKPKGQKMPAKLFMEIQRNRALKEKRLEEEARESGLVTISDKERRRRKNEKERQKFKEKRKNIGSYGPAPDIGFMTHGMYKVH